jgi:acyl-CoA synthetase
MPSSTEWRLRAVPPELARHYLDTGLWTDSCLGDLIDAGLRRNADLDFRVRSSTRPFRGRFGDVHVQARRVAGALRSRGIGAGDVVAFQLPNWVEAPATFYAACMLGAVVVPIVHFYGIKEVRHILKQSRARVFVCAERFRHLDYVTMLEQLMPELPDLELVTVVGDQAPAGTLDFATFTEAAPLEAAAKVDPDLPALVAYTSGTTAEPKGVIHVHRTIVAEMQQMRRQAPPSLVGAPVGHAIGMLGALLLPVHHGQPIHLIDIWEPGTVLAAMVEDGLAAGNGATYFLTSLLDHPDYDDRHRRLMSRVALGGAPVPAPVADRVQSLGISLVRFYGSTEHPSVSGCEHDDPADKRLHTDGRPLAGVEVRIVDDSGREIPAGEPGEIVTRGPDCFAGYTDWTLTQDSVDADGWYATGDVGVLDGEGYLTITDRKKDIIIRGGENISALEVEELLMRTPGIAEVAVVAAPDSRLGEHACAFVRLHPGAPVPTVHELRARLEAAGLGRQKCPEEVRVVVHLPRTASGKVQKFALRDALRREGSAPGASGR